MWVFVGTAVDASVFDFGGKTKFIAFGFDLDRQFTGGCNDQYNWSIATFQMRLTWGKKERRKEGKKERRKEGKKERRKEGKPHQYTNTPRRKERERDAMNPGVPGSVCNRVEWRLCVCLCVCLCMAVTIACVAGTCCVVCVVCVVFEAVAEFARLNHVDVHASPLSLSRYNVSF